MDLRDGRVARVSPSLDEAAQAAVDLDHRLVLPGFLDAHLHLDKAYLSADLPLSGLTGDAFFMALKAVKRAYTTAYMATTAGATITLGADAPLGRLEPGNLADLVLIDRRQDLEDWSLGLAAHAPAGQPPPMLPEVLFRGASRRNVRHVMVDGAWAVRDGHSTRVSERDVVTELRQHLRV